MEMISNLPINWDIIVHGSCLKYLLFTKKNEKFLMEFMIIRITNQVQHGALMHTSSHKELPKKLFNILPLWELPPDWEYNFLWPKLNLKVLWTKENYIYQDQSIEQGTDRLQYNIIMKKLHEDYEIELKKRK